MPGIDKAAFLKRIGSKAPDYGDSVPGEGSPEEEAGESDEEAKQEGDMTCGEQLLQGIKSSDAGMIDDALKEAVARYGK